MKYLTVILAIILGLIFLCAFWIAVRDLRHLGSIADLRQKNPVTTALMEQRRQEAKSRGSSYRPRQQFIPYSRISPHLKHAVLVAEDAGFFSHRGVDYEELKESIKTDWQRKRFARGASTITMQLCKNLYLSTAKNPLRKISEIILAYKMDRTLRKNRIFELYLNYIEWGEGLFGCEAASQAYFGCSSSELSPEQAIRLASIIINPRRWGPFSDTKRMNQRRRLISERMYDAGFLTLEEFQALPF